MIASVLLRGCLSLRTRPCMPEGRRKVDPSQFNVQGTSQPPETRTIKGEDPRRGFSRGRSSCICRRADSLGRSHRRDMICFGTLPRPPSARPNIPNLSGDSHSAWKSIFFNVLDRFFVTTARAASLSCRFIQSHPVKFFHRNLRSL